MSFINKIIQYQRKKLFKNFDAAVNHVKHGIYHSIKGELSKTNNDEFAGLLAAAVTNELFALQATTPEAKDFASKNKHSIEAEIKKLRNNTEILKILNICLRLRAKIIYENVTSGTALKINGKAIDNLRKYGLFIVDIELPSTAKFIGLSRKFHKKAMNLIW